MEQKWILPYDLQWFAKDGPGGEKTEPATEKKLREAREEGQVAKSKELTSAFCILVLFLSLKIFASMMYTRFMNIFSSTYNDIPDFVSECALAASAQAVGRVFGSVILQMTIIVLPFFALGFAITLVISIVQVGWKPTLKPMKPKLERFSPIKGFKRIFSKDSLFELVKSILKLAVIAVVAYVSIRSDANKLFILYDVTLQQAIALIGTVIVNTGIKIAAAYLIVGFADFIYQRYRFSEEMKMTKQEVKDEYKNTEGNPEVKGRQRQRMREASQRRMMQDVPKADVVITNPTHLAVALRYDPETSRAPIVVAKGEDYLAMKIRESAQEHHIEIVENKPLARMLYANVDIGAEIPPELYQAVAEILAAVFKARNEGGVA